MHVGSSKTGEIHNNKKSHIVPLSIIKLNYYMNPAEDCLKYLQKRDWMGLNKLLVDNEFAVSLADSPTFTIFENVLIDELRRSEDESNEDLHIVAAQIFQLHNLNQSKFRLSENALLKTAKFLFEKDPCEIYAAILVDDPEAQLFLRNQNSEIQSKINNSRISANLDIKIGGDGNLRFDKEIFNNSPQEKELFFAARNVFPDSFLLPNSALSTIIDSKVCQFLNSTTTTFFYQSTLDLCIVNPKTFMPELFIELDSSWHDIEKNKKNDKMKDEIFQKAGLILHRLRKIENKDMTEIFELYLKKIAINKS
jgi:hypothetical protein